MSGIIAIFNPDPAHSLPLSEQQRFFEIACNRLHQRGRHTMGVLQVKANGATVKETRDTRKKPLVYYPDLGPSVTTLAVFHTIPDEEFRETDHLNNDEIQPFVSGKWAVACDGEPRVHRPGPRLMQESAEFYDQDLPGYSFLSLIQRGKHPLDGFGQVGGVYAAAIASGPYLWVGTKGLSLYAYVVAKYDRELILVCSCPISDAYFEGYRHRHFPLLPGSRLQLEVGCSFYDRLADPLPFPRYQRTGEVLALCAGPNSRVAAAKMAASPDVSRMTLLYFGREDDAQGRAVNDLREFLQGKYPQKTFDLLVQEPCGGGAGGSNLLRLTQAAEICRTADYDTLVLGNTLSDSYRRDSTPEFWQRAQLVLSQTLESAPLLVSPLAYLTGREIRNLAQELGVKEGV